MNIIELVDKVSELEGWEKTKTSNVKTCARRFAKVLGYIPKQCFENVYNISEKERTNLLEKALNEINIKNPTFKNTKSQLKTLFNTAYKHSLISKKEITKLEPVCKLSNRRPRIMNIKTPFEKKPYSLKFEKWSDKTKNQFREYELWATAEYEETRERRKIRKSTIKFYKNVFECYFGFLVLYENIDIEKVDLTSITNIELVKKFVSWHIRDRMGNRISGQIIHTLKSIHAFCNNYPLTKNKYVAEEVSKIMKRLGNPKPVIDKQKQLSTFEELMSCAISEFPQKNRYYAPHQHRLRSGIRLANRAGRSVAIMLIASVTLRNQNWREAQLGRHIFKDEETGLWHVHFRGDDDMAQLKKEFDKRGNVNIVHREVYPLVATYLEEYVNFWRPLIINYNSIKPEHINYMFFDTNGEPYDAIRFSDWIQFGTLKWLGKRINPHNFRHSIASQHLLENGNIELTAEIINDDPMTVYRHYFLPNKDEINKKHKLWMDQKLENFKK